jgi:hypothetical protein
VGRILVIEGDHRNAALAQHLRGRETAAADSHD